MRNFINIIETVQQDYFTKSAYDFAKSQTSSKLSNWTLVEMSPEQFLMLAKDGFSQTKSDRVESLNGQFPDIPFLQFKNESDEIGQVYNHEGRHRAKWLLKHNVAKMPVLIVCLKTSKNGVIQWGKIAAGETPNNIPKLLVGEDNRYTLTMPKSIIFPINYSLNESRENHSFENDMYVIFNNDKIVVHTTGKNAAEIIRKEKFRTGYELNIAERRKAIYFSAKDVNPDMYARNEKGEIYNGQSPDYIEANIRGLKLLNMTYRQDEMFTNHKLYSSLVTKGEIDKIPLEIDGTISFLDDGRIYEVCLPVEIANKVIIK